MLNTLLVMQTPQTPPAGETSLMCCSGVILVHPQVVKVGGPLLWTLICSFRDLQLDFSQLIGWIVIAALLSFSKPV